MKLLIWLIDMFFVVVMVFVCIDARAEEWGKASYYTTASCQREGTSGVYTANGERYNEKAFTCALPRRDFGKWYRVTNYITGESIIVRHNDYGPGKGPRSRGVIIDLTPTAFKALGASLGSGLAQVVVEPVNVDSRGI